MFYRPTFRTVTAHAICCGAFGGGPKMAKTIAATGNWRIEIVKRTDFHHFIVLPKRWIVERTFAWISRNRRLARDFERHATTVAAFIRLAMIRLMLKRLTRSTPCR
jgi:transposase